MSANTTQAELARKISAGEKTGRYDIAYKAEVRAFVELELAEFGQALALDLRKLSTADVEMTDRLDPLEEKVDRDALATLRRLATIERRLGEIELTWWQRVRRSLGIVAAKELPRDPMKYEGRDLTPGQRALNDVVVQQEPLP